MENQKFEYTEEKIQYVILLIKQFLTPDLLKYKFRKKNLHNPMFGHCKHASQSLVILMNTDKLILMDSKDHMWVQDEDKIYDITMEQYYSIGCNPPYYRGKPSIIQKNDRSTKILVDRVLCASSTSGTVLPESPAAGSIITR